MLTPRTPRRQRPQNEDDYEQIPLGDDVEYRTPLIGSPPEKRKTKSEDTSGFSNALSKLSFGVGLLAALFLLLLIGVSWLRQDALLQFISTTTSSLNTVSVEKTNAHSISYDKYTNFPLSPQEFRIECVKVQNMMTGPMRPYWYIPPDGPMDVPHKNKKQTCSSTITYMLDGYVGLAADLAIMAQVAGFAKEQNRTFLVNDQHWNRGRWTDHFEDVRVHQPGPEPDCLAPPPEEFVACPRVARHWIVNSRTAVFHFGHHFQDTYEDPYAWSLRRQRPIFNRTLDSFSQTIRPKAETTALIRTARQELASHLKNDASFPTDSSPSSYVSVHIRRGDRKAETPPYRGDYIPISNYLSATLDAWERLEPLQTNRVIWLASDSPAAMDEFKSQLSSNDNLQIVSLRSSTYPELRRAASKREYVQLEFNDLWYHDRVEATRGAIVDLALASGLWSDADDPTPLAAVCAISSNFCKLAAVGLGWERAFGLQGDVDVPASKRWVEIDNSDRIEPAWRALEMF